MVEPIPIVDPNTRVEPIPVVDPNTRVEPIPIVDPYPRVDHIPIVDPNPRVDHIPMNCLSFIHCLRRWSIEPFPLVHLKARSTGWA